MAKELVWIDLEMTGLNPQIHKIIEIATIITDSELNIIAKGPDLVIKASDDELNKMNFLLGPIVEKIILNNDQLSALSSLRDTLLPKLMSGEVRVEQKEAA